MPRLAVLGHPVAHSRSPAMQSAALTALGLADKWSYEAIDVEPARFESLVAELAGSGFAGVNVTVPHKLAARGLADHSSAAVEVIGAANTLSFTDGGVRADNTDASGLITALAAAGYEPDGTRALILGAGGSARACAWALGEAGAGVAIHNRTAERARELAARLGLELAEPRADGRLDPSGFELIVNTTSVGLDTANARDADAAQLLARRASDLKALQVDADALGEGHTVVDLVYGEHATALIEAARGKQAKTVEGIEILVAQGADSLRIWTGADPPLDVMLAAAVAGS